MSGMGPFATGPPDERCFQSSAKCRPEKIVGWQVSRKRSSVVQSFAAAWTQNGVSGPMTYARPLCTEN
jgi:hypothetical protein